jgi:Xaa-Pro aminopeptidase
LRGRAHFLWLLLASCAGPARSVEPAASTGLPGPTPEERFLDASRVQFEPGVHAGRRARLAAALRVSGGVFLAPAADGFSGGETFRQLDDFLYFTGLELPNSVLTVDADAGSATVFAPRRDARFESTSRPNDFPGRPLADDAAIARRAGIDVRPIEELDATLDAWITAGRTLYVNGGRGRAVEPPATAFVRSVSAEEVLLEHVRASWPDARVDDAFPAIARLRMVKGPEEVAVLRRAAAITCAGIRAAAAEVRTGVDERTLEGVMEAAWKRRGAQRRAFDSIVKSGPNSLWPWRVLAASYDRRNRVLAEGDLVIFDVGCELDHYASDVGRTFPASGRFTPEQRRRLELSTSVADAVIAAVRPGVTLRDLQAVAEAHIPEEERPHMQTGLFFGHHVGLAVGDPSLADEPLAPGAVFTVEPWYYDHADGIAVFVEDMVLVTEDGAENLTATLPRSPDELERMVRGR